MNVSGRIYTGALVGYNQGIVEGCTVSGTVTGESEVGLLAGRNAGTIASSAAAGTVTGTGNDSTGGLVGANSTGTIRASMAQSAVVGTVNVGGLVGYNDRAAISDCYAVGSVTATTMWAAWWAASGGSGYSMTCSITNSYADSHVEGNTAGGLVGFNDRHITNCFSTGTVSGGIAAGGLVGRTTSMVWSPIPTLTPRQPALPTPAPSSVKTAVTLKTWPASTAQPSATSPLQRLVHGCTGF